MGRFGSASSPSSHESTCNYQSLSIPKPPLFHQTTHLTTDLRLGLTISTSDSSMPWDSDCTELKKEENECSSATFFVKVYMEGIPIGRKLDLLAHDGYHELITTLDHMFCTNIIWSEMDGEHTEQCHVLTYEDKEGDWLMVGDVPWEMFLCCVKRLKITRAEI
ncbi:auxin-responsive protein IAA30 [Euphorbia lathyris]|uniref:auxin-responsive protein IAA30 n=1 Tax=Euphorbia lathyris TaxID=212925 RepID=UPI0033144D1F